MTKRPALLFYCQHSLGLGHLVRSLALAQALARRFRVVLLNGGLLPETIGVPEGLEIVALPPLGMDTHGCLVSRDNRYSVERAQAVRRETMLAALASVRPSIVLVELFPFGRRKFAGELVPLLAAARDRRAIVISSLRDILVTGRTAQGDHDERASVLANRYCDAVLVHSDPGFARLEDSFTPRTRLRIPVHHTGFVVPGPAAVTGSAHERRHVVLVSAGGGRVGEPLLRAAVEAHALLWPAERLGMKLVAGPFLPEATWADLSTLTAGQPELSLHRSVPNLAAEMAASAASVSQCGYNTALDILRAGVPALAVPYGEGGEDEQMNRARRLEQAGAIRVLEPERLDGVELAREISLLLRFRPRPMRLALDGAEQSTRIVATLLRERDGAPVPRLMARGLR